MLDRVLLRIRAYNPIYRIYNMETRQICSQVKDKRSSSTIEICFFRVIALSVDELDRSFPICPNFCLMCQMSTLHRVCDLFWDEIEKITPINKKIKNFMNICRTGVFVFEYSFCILSLLSHSFSLNTVVSMDFAASWREIWIYWRVYRVRSIRVTLLFTISIFDDRRNCSRFMGAR